jgi:hypothetical protein
MPSSGMATFILGEGPPKDYYPILSLAYTQNPLVRYDGMLYRGFLNKEKQ